MPALPQPTTRGGVGRPSKAIRARAWSCLTAHNDHQGDGAARGKCAWGLRRLPHGHSAHGGVRVNLVGKRHSDFAQRFLPDRRHLKFCLPSSNLARVSARVLSHSHRFAGSLPSLSRSRVRVPSRRASGTHSMRVQGSRPSRAHTLGHQHLFQHVADLPHVSRRLSSSLFTCCINKCQQARTRAWKSHPRTWIFHPSARAA